MQNEIQLLKQQIQKLQTEHRNLDDIIAKLSAQPNQDQLHLQRLKKRKLILKDRIMMLERQLMPDIPA